MLGKIAGGLVWIPLELHLHYRSPRLGPRQANHFSQMDIADSNERLI
jgi:hypothetical protein